MEALVRGKVDLPNLWIAKALSTPDRDRIAELLEGDQDLLLSAAAQVYVAVAKDERAKDGLRRLSALADELETKRAATAGRRAPRSGTLRLSWLLDPVNIAELYALAEETQSAGGVRRSVHRAVSELLAHNYGKARLHDIMLNVRKPAVSDERHVRVSPDELRDLLDAASAFEPLFGAYRPRDSLGRRPRPSHTHPSAVLQ